MSQRFSQEKEDKIGCTASKGFRGGRGETIVLEGSGFVRANDKRHSETESKAERFGAFS